MIDPQTILTLSQEIIDALGLDDSAREAIAAELASCSNERLMEMTKHLGGFYKNVTQTANSINGQIVRDRNIANEEAERADVSNSLSFV